jgi:hypothetical protein
VLKIFHLLSYLLHTLKHYCAVCICNEGRVLRLNSLCCRDSYQCAMWDWRFSALNMLTAVASMQKIYQGLGNYIWITGIHGGSAWNGPVYHTRTYFCSWMSYRQLSIYSISFYLFTFLWWYIVFSLLRSIPALLNFYFKLCIEVNKFYEKHKDLKRGEKLSAWVIEVSVYLFSFNADNGIFYCIITELNFMVQDFFVNPNTNYFILVLLW